MNYYDQELLRLMARERREQRVRQGDAERLAREIKREAGTGDRRLQVLWRARHRAAEPRLES